MKCYKLLKGCYRKKNIPVPACGSASLESSTGVLSAERLVSPVDAGFKEAETLSSIRATSCHPRLRVKFAMSSSDGRVGPVSKVQCFLNTKTDEFVHHMVLILSPSVLADFASFIVFRMKVLLHSTSVRTTEFTLVGIWKNFFYLKLRKIVNEN